MFLKECSGCCAKIRIRLQTSRRSRDVQKCAKPSRQSSCRGFGKPCSLRSITSFTKEKLLWSGWSPSCVMELTALATPCRAPTRDFAGSDAPGKVIIASRWRAFSTGLFFTAYMGIFADSGIIKDYTKGIKSMMFSSFFSKNAFGGK